MEERHYWLGFSQCNGIGPVKFRQLLDYFKTAEKAWNASESELVASGIGKVSAEQVQDHKKRFSLDRYIERMQKQEVDYTILSDADYPKLLKQTAKPPYVLYIKGNKALLQQDDAIAVVGTRKITDYGRQVTETLTEELARAGFIIVSGLALGVDAVAHTAALEANGKTIAVLGSGVDYCTPRENEKLYTRILGEGGTILSEAPLGQMPNKGSFPSRNRIIAGMSLGVLVTEGAEDSGSLITASNAASLHRKVFAVPGPITSSVSSGTNILIAKGAIMVRTAHDVIDEINLHAGRSVSQRLTQRKGDTKEEQKVLDLLSMQNLHFDEIVRETGFTSSQVGTLVSLLEMKGYIMSLSSGKFGLAE